MKLQVRVPRMVEQKKELPLNEVEMERWRGAEERYIAKDKGAKEDSEGREVGSNTDGADVLIPVEIAVTVGTGGVAATVTARKTGGRRAGTAEATGTGSREVKSKTYGRTKDEKLADGEA